MMRDLKFIVLLCTFSCVWTIDIFIDGPVVLRDCRGHDDTKMFETTTTSHIAEGSVEPKVPSEGVILTVGNQEFLVVTSQWLNWDDARAWCQDQFGDLASPSDPRALRDRMEADGHTYGAYWVGGRKFIGWVNGQPITTGWGRDSYEPDGSGDCVYLWPLSSGGPLGDDPCSKSSHVICER